MYSQTLYAGWADMDFNSHMASTAYLNKCVDVRLMLFAKNGFPASELARLKVAMRDELEYFREVGLLQEIVVTNALAGLSDDGSRWAVRQEVLNTDGKLCARNTSVGGFLDLAVRKLVAPPENLLAVFKAMDRTEDFTVLQSSIKATPAAPSAS